MPRRHADSKAPPEGKPFSLPAGLLCRGQKKFPERGAVTVGTRILCGADDALLFRGCKVFRPSNQRLRITDNAAIKTERIKRILSGMLLPPPFRNVSENQFVSAENGACR